MNDDAITWIAGIWALGFYTINSLFSKKDGRFKNGLKPGSLSFFGWILQLIWGAGAFFLIKSQM